MISGKGVKQKERRTTTAEFVNNFGASPLDGLRGHPASIANSGIGDLLRARRSLAQFRLARHHDPRDHIRQKTCAAENRDEHPDEADQRDVKIEVFREAKANPGNSTAVTWTHQALPPRWGAGHTFAAISAKIGVVLNDLAAIVAIHLEPPWRLIR